MSVKAETEVKEQLGREWPSLYVVLGSPCWGVFLAQCPLDATSLLPSKRETKPGVGLLPVPVQQATQLVEFNIR